MSATFIDGEALGKKQLYSLMTDSNKRSIFNKHGLTFREITKFLLESSTKLVFIYGANYDFTNWINASSKLRRLFRNSKNEGRSITVGELKISYIPSKLFVISKGHHTLVAVWDLCNFMQTSFINALEKASLPIPENILRGKAARGTFQLKDLEEVKTYSLKECELGLRLTNQLLDALAQSGIKLRNYYGAASIGKWFLRRYKVHDHYPKLMPYGARRASKYAFYGGRIEILKRGQFKQAHSIDFVSAYPHCAMSLPCLRHGSWLKLAQAKDIKLLSSTTPAMVRVKWKCADRLVGPLPYRDTRGSLSYPLEGEAWHHWIEVFEAIRLFGASSFDLKEAYVWRQTCNHKPFEAMISHLYKMRESASSYIMNTVFKIALNSTYGVTSQHPIGTSRSPFYELFYAGMITASTRARLLRTLNDSKIPDNQIISFATDNIKTIEPLSMLTVKTLGGQEVNTHKSLIMLEAGVWQDSEQTKTRGFGKIRLTPILKVLQHQQKRFGQDTPAEAPIQNCKMLMTLKQGARRHKPELTGKIITVERVVRWYPYDEKRIWFTNKDSTPHLNSNAPLSAMYSPSALSVQEYRSAHRGLLL